MVGVVGSSPIAPTNTQTRHGVFRVGFFVVCRIPVAICLPPVAVMYCLPIHRAAVVIRGNRMNKHVADILQHIRQLEEDLEAELQRRRHALQADFEDRRVHFEAALLEQQRRFRMGLLHYMLSAEWRHLACIPFIYGLIVPMLLLDLALTLYQWACFPLFRIQKVRRRDCWVFDRAHLGYLNALEKLNCAYCSYGNGLMAYAREIVARTEQYWCPIKHARKVMAAHPYYTGFVDFGDAESYKQELERLRTQLAEINQTSE